MNSSKVIGREVGTVFVHMYEENLTGLPIFHIESENKYVLSISRIIEKALHE